MMVKQLCLPAHLHHLTTQYDFNIIIGDHYDEYKNHTVLMFSQDMMQSVTHFTMYFSIANLISLF